MKIASVSRNTLTLLVNNAGSALLSFTLSILIGRVLGEDGLGVYAAALAWVYPLSVVAEFGLGTLITRDVAQNPASVSELLRSAALARLLLGGTLMLALVIFAPLLTDSAALVRGLHISAPLIIILPFFSAFSAVFRAYQVMWPVAWLNLGMLVAQVILTALVFTIGGGVAAALAVNTATSAGQLLAAWAIWRYLPLIREQQFVGVKRASPFWVHHARATGTLLRRAWPFALAGILAAAQMRIGVILLEALVGSAQVGYYAAANRFVDAARMIPNALFGALLPALATETYRADRLFSRAAVGLSLYSAVLILVVGLLAPLILRLTFGGSFLPATPALQIALFALLPSLLRSARTLYWYAHGDERFVNRVSGLALLLQIVLSLGLILSNGAVGAALAMLIAESAALVILVRRNVPPR